MYAMTRTTEKTWKKWDGGVGIKKKNGHKVDHYSYLKGKVFMGKKDGTSHQEPSRKNLVK